MKKLKQVFSFSSTISKMVNLIDQQNQAKLVHRFLPNLLRTAAYKNFKTK
jgi:hypothetical protein